VMPMTPPGQNDAACDPKREAGNGDQREPWPVDDPYCGVLNVERRLARSHRLVAAK
jgi:hypothetical protein